MPRQIYSQDEINHEKELIELEMVHRPLLKMPGGSHMTFITEKRTGRTVPVAHQFAAVVRLRGDGDLSSDESIAVWLQEQCAAVFATGRWRQ
jgi:hypothetical protein